MSITKDQAVNKYTSLLTRPAEEYVNDENIEMKWAAKAFKMAEVHYGLITTMRPSMLKLTKFDDDIYKEFRQDFPKVDITSLKDEEFKTPEAKAKWRPFMNHFEGQVADYNQGCLLRISHLGEYNEDNTMLSTRIQYLAVEIARNREGLNDQLYEQEMKKKKEEKEKAETN